jgi:Putative amidoligase enzyme
MRKEMTFKLGFETEFTAPIEAATLSRGLGQKGIAIMPQGRDANTGGRAYDRWFLVPDGSIRPQIGFFPYELVSPIMTFDDGLQNMKIIFDYMSAIGSETNDSTGFHVGLSFTDARRIEKMDNLKLVLLLNESKVLRTFGRTSNRYCMGHLQDLRKTIRTIAQQYTGGQAQVDRLVDTEDKLRRIIQTDKYRTVNFGKLRTGYLEFRAMGGRDYHKKYDQIVETIHHFAECMDAASDPTKFEGKHKRGIRELLRTTERVIIRNLETVLRNEETTLVQCQGQLDQSLARQQQLQNLLNEVRENGIV